MRPANTLYEFGRTLLVVKNSGAEILNADFNDSLTDVCGRPFDAAIIIIIIIDIGQIVRAVDHPALHQQRLNLGLHQRTRLMESR
jgi:hypothetical protein